ncbi:MAG: Ig-like domain-containing protein, partial [Clostridia bacterium]|nr:Ig-like domain-containing protein [Clostridia bacterium]
MQNKKFRSFISIVLIISILFSFSFVFSASAATKTGYITHDSLRVRTTPTTVSTENILKHNDTTINLHTNDTVTIIEKVNSLGDDNYPTWYKIKFTYSGKSYEGYVPTNFVKEKVTDTSGVVLDGVPELYKEYIKNLKAEHPDWNFVFYDTGIEWSNLFTKDAQGYIGRSLIENVFPISYRSTESGAYNWRTDKFIAQDAGRWYQANTQTIEYYMDPRNFMTDESIFMFESLKYDEKAHTIEGVESILKGSFMADKTIVNLNDEEVSYAQAFMDAAKASGVSPYHLAARTLQEVGKTGTSGSVNGSSGYYNYYNIGASSGSDPVANGLKYAATTDERYNLPWNTPYKAIVGGAKWIGTGYIDKGQDTLYYQKFNVVKKVWTHQYMTNIMAPYQESEDIYKSYKSLNILDLSYVFVIPYYKNMPSKACQLPKKSDASPNNWLSSLTVEGCIFEFDGGKTSGYSVTVAESVSSVNITAKSVNSKATITGIGKVELSSRTNSHKIIVKAENGNTRTYYIDIIRSTENNIPLKGISLDKNELSMFNGESKTLTVKYNPSNTTDNKSVVWTSSDSSVAKVNNGEVVAIGIGEATITAKVGTYTATCKVIV